jgi:hypothetical protein
MSIQLKKSENGKKMEEKDKNIMKSQNKDTLKKINK